MQVKRILSLTTSDVKRHRAVPALASTKDGTLLIAYRSGTDHVDTGDGSIRLLRSENGEKWIDKPFAPEDPEFDMRVNHGMTLLDGIVYFPYQEHVVIDNNSMCRTIIVTSDDGEKWNPLLRDNVPKFFFPYGRLFMTERKLHIPGYFIYDRIKYSHSSIRTLDQKFFNIAGEEFSIGRENSRFNEADICASGKGFIAVVRNENENCAYIVTSMDALHWGVPLPLPFCIQAPCLLKVKDKLLLAGRELKLFQNKFGLNRGKVVGTSLRESLDNGYTWSKPLLIDEAYSWDTGYPSAIVKDGLVYVAFYSEFVRGNSNIMLAIVDVN